MASKIILKKSSEAAKVPVADDLEFGELALNYTDSKLYFKKADGTTIDAFTGSAASGTVTSVGLTSGTGISVSGSPITTSGNITVTNTAPNVTTDISTTHNATTVVVNSSDGTDGTINAATTSLAGVMTGADKTKLDGIAAGATNVTNNNQLTNGAGYITSTESITGNAATATTLQIARTINGVSFNGSANITVADSTKLPLAGGAMTGPITGTDASADAGALTVRGGNSSSSGVGGALNISGGNTVSTTAGKNGGTVTVKGGDNTSASGGLGGLLELGGGAAVLGTGGQSRLYSGDSKGTNRAGSDLMLFAGKGTGTGVGGTFRIYTSGTTTSGTGLQTSTSRFEINNVGQISALANIASSSTTTGTLRVTGGVGVSGTVYAAGFNGALTGNASTATTLQNARTINGTSFNGSANITTANWGTARTLTVGNTGKSVDGSANVAWSLAEIGAYAATNPSGYTTNTGTVTSVSGSGSVSGLSLSGAVTTSGSLTLSGTLSASIDNITDEARLFNNMGQNHTTQTDFNAIADFGARFVQGGTNGPTGVGTNQFYGFTLGLGNDYGLGSYASQFYWPRATQNADTYIYVRDREGGTWGSWRKTKAGYADTAGSAGSAGSTSLLTSPNGATVVAADSAMPSVGNSLIHTLAQGPSGNDGHILGMTWANTTSIHGAQLFIDTDPTNTMAFRSRSSTGVWTGWTTVLHSGNFSSYAAPASHVHNYIPIDSTFSTAAAADIPFIFRKTSNGTNNGATLLVQNDYGSHSWGITGEFRVTGASDRPSILFSSDQTSTTWSVGYGYNDDQFRISQNHGHRNGSWGTERFRIDTSGNAFANVSMRSPIFYDSDNTAYYGNFASTSNLNALNVNSLNVGDGNLQLYKSQTVDLSNTSVYSESNFYPVIISVPTSGVWIEVQNNLNSNVPTWSTHSGGFTLNLRWSTNGSGWGVTEIKRRVEQYHERFTNQQICGGISQLGNSSNEVVWLRGGGSYFFKFSRNLTAVPQSSNYTIHNQTADVRTTAFNSIWNSATGAHTSYNTRFYADTAIDSPIYYDRNDTAYYVDPAGNSELKYTRFSVSGYPIVAFNNTNSSDYGLIEWTESGVHKTWMGMGGSAQSLGENAAYAQDGFSINHDGGGALTISNRGTSRWIRFSTGDENTGNFHTLNVRNGDVIVNQNAITYSIMDNTPVVGVATTNRLHVNGSIQLTGNNDAIVFGRGTSTFLKDEELGFGWGGGWYMTDDTYLRVRGSKILYNDYIIRSDTDMRAPIFYDQNDTAYYVNPNSFSQLSSGNFNAAPSGRTLSLGGDQLDRVFDDANRSSLVINAAYYPHLYINATANVGNANHGAVFSMTGNLTAGGYRRWGMGIANTDPDCFSWGYYDNNSNPHYSVGGTFGYTSTGSKMWLNTGGSLWTTGDMRTPIFYDSNDTGYYVDPNSGSRLLHIFAGNVASSNDGGWNARMNLVGSSHARLDVVSNSDGIVTTMYSHTGQGVGKVGTYSNHPLVLMAQGATEGGSVYAGSLRSPIFYDSNDTAYYANPNETSNLSRVTLTNGNLALTQGDGTGLRITTAYGYINFGAQNSSWTHVYSDKSFYTNQDWYVNGNLIHHDGNAGRARNSYLMYYQGFTLDANTMATNATGFTYAVNAPAVGPIARFSTGGDYDLWLNAPYSGGGNNLYFRTRNGDAGSVNSWRALVSYGINYSDSIYASIYYDANDTGYYVDPNAISSMYGIAIRGDTSASDVSNQIFFWGSGATTTSAIGFKSNAGSFSNPTGNGDGYNTYLTMDTPGRGWVFREGLGGANFGAAYTSGWILNNGLWQANSSMRAPIFYDSDDTSYYVNPNSGSRIYDLNIEGASNKYLYLNPGNGYEAMVRYNGGSGSGWYVGKRTASVLVGTESFHFYSEAAGATVGGVDTGGNIFASGSHRAPIFYDSNNTAYYVDPNTYTYLYGGIANNGAHGNSTIMNRLLAENNGAATGEVRLQMWCSEPGITWDWAGFGYNVINDGGTPSGFGRPNTGFGQAYMRMGTGGQWYFYTTNTSGTRYTNMYLAPGNGVETYGILRNDTDVRAPIYYDSNDTAFYLDPNTTGTSLNVAGAIVAAGNITANSDESLKTDWSQLPADYVEKLSKLLSGTFTRKDTGQRQTGIGAQSLQKFLPEAVVGETILSVAYGNAAMVSAVELAKRVVEQDARIAKLEERLSKLLGD